jgi:hypothetical protein
MYDFMDRLVNLALPVSVISVVLIRIHLTEEEIMRSA